MDAPVTTSADNGTSGGGDGWFRPRKQPSSAPGTEPQGAEPQGTEGRRLAGLRPVGRGTTAPAEAAPQHGAQADAEARIAAPTTPEPTESPATTVLPKLIPAPATAVPPLVSSVPSRPYTDASHTASEPLQVPAQRTAPNGPPPADALLPTPSEEPRPAFTDTLQAEPSEAYDREAPRFAAESFEAFASETSPSPEALSLPASDTLPVVEPEPVAEGSPDAVLIRRTMAAIGGVADKVTSYFYALLFVRHPDLRPLFPPAMDAQRDRLLKALLTAAEHIDNKPVLVDYLQNLGRGHRKYGTRPEHYPAVGECLIEALAKYAESVWEPETEAAWVRTYTTISQVMIDAAAVDELRAPAWWQAEVVSHELRTPDIAVLTVRPNQPYPFLAGQYASLETPWWPRIWRHYSFASAPRSDGLLSFHVKAIPAGWVSGALVHRAQLGDVIRLGPPAGSMTVDHTRDSGLLCLGGGTGIAPIKALVEDVAEHGTRRRMEVFYGARTDHDLYDIDTMLRLKQAHSWLEVRPVVDKHGLMQLPDAIRTFGPWDEYDAYLSGPVGMIRSGVDALRGVGIPKERIRHDSVAELVAAG